MTIKSMTGFGRTEGASADATWHWELRTVNGRGLDVRVRLPTGHDDLENSVRKICAKHFKRGNCSVTLNVKRDQGSMKIQLNEAVFSQVLLAARRAAEISGGAVPDPGALLGMRGVLETIEVEEGADERKARLNALLESFEGAVELTARARAAEGAHLEEAVKAQIDRIEAITRAITQLPSRQTEFIRQRMREGVARLLEDANMLNEDRLYHEAALLAQRADVEEELKRLEAHIAAAKGLLQSEDAVGRQLDFLAQEFNREANTLCSKSNDTEMTKLGLDLKAVIEQMREQIQNIE